MNKFRLSLLGPLLFANVVTAAQPAPAITSEPTNIPALKGLNIVEGKDKRMHLLVDGQRIGSFQVDRAWAAANSGLTIIPPQYWEPPVKKPLKPKDPCIYASAGAKCLPDFTKQGPLIKLPNDIREIGVLTRKK